MGLGNRVKEEKDGISRSQEGLKKGRRKEKGLCHYTWK